MSTFSVTHRFARIAPRKARLVADMIRGNSVDEALTALTFSKRRGAYYIKNLLKSAMANAEEQDADVASLIVSESRVDEGPTIKRFQPKDRGRAHPIMKRTSHIHLSLSDQN
ncbi:MAG: 50S ribosomal protein L22 [Phycisphaerae bacterium]|nr:50S ribosomal protein L22 [Phycisphaerae bacterium]